MQPAQTLCAAGGGAESFGNGLIGRIREYQETALNPYYSANQCARYVRQVTFLRQAGHTFWAREGPAVHGSRFAPKLLGFCGLPYAFAAKLSFEQINRQMDHRRAAMRAGAWRLASF